LVEFLPERWALGNSEELNRQVGARAQQAALLAKARRLDTAGDATAAASVYRELAQAIWESHSDFGKALECARRAHALDPSDSTRLLLAEWYERLGAHRASAEMLLGLSATSVSAQPGDLQARLAGLFLRAGDAAAACSHFAEVARTDSNGTSALVAIATMAGWAPEQVSRERGVVAWHEAARRFKSGGAVLRAFEATHRAFEMDPASSLAAERLAQELAAINRPEAADEVWRQSANTAGDTTRHEVRAVVALENGDVLRALVALLDARADTAFEPSELVRAVDHLLAPQRGVSRGIDRILAELGCADWLAVRLEAGPLLERWSDEASCHVALGRLETAYFAHHEAAREAMVRAVMAQPNHPEARARLADWSGAGAAPDPLLRSLVQAARVASGGLGCRQLAQEIVDRTREDLNVVALRLWAIDQLRLTGHVNDDLRAEHAARLEQAATQRLELDAELAELQRVPLDERPLALQRLERRLALDPYAAVDHLFVVHQLVECDATDPAAQSAYAELLDVVARQAAVPARSERLTQALADVPRLLGERGMVAQARFHLRHGQVETALGSLLPLVDLKQASVRGLFWLFTLARRFRNALASARALQRIADAFRPQVRSALLCLAAGLYVEAGDLQSAQQLAEEIPRTAQNLPRLVLLELNLASHGEAAVSWENLEHSLSKVLPSAYIYSALGRAHRADGEFELALAWIQRAIALRPFDMSLRGEQLELALRVGDAVRVAEITRDLMTQALPASEWVEGAASALGWMSSVDLALAAKLAKEILEYIGPGSPSLRAALLDVARAIGDEQLALEVLERAAALAPEPAPIYLAIAERRWEGGEIEQGLVAALRAAESGAPVDTWVNYAWVSTAELSTDAQLRQIELLRLMYADAPDSTALLGTLRRLAVARFDLAQDTDGAVEAWYELAERSQGRLWCDVARDMGEVLGVRAAVQHLVEASKTHVAETDRAKLLGLASQVAFELGDFADALRYLEEAQLASAEAIGLLPFGERIALAANAPEALESLYSVVDAHVLGVFAERSLHFRAAHAFAKLRDWPLALRHALHAFETRPEDVSTWNALVSLSRMAGQPQTIALSAMRVAEASRDRSQSHQWLERAYQELGDSPDEVRLRFDLAIRMLVGVPQVSGVRRVADCIRQMQSHEFEEIDFIRMRFARALESLTEDLEGPDGARLGIAMAGVSAQALGRSDLAARALFSAVKADADLEEYATVAAELASSVASNRETWAPVIERILEWMERPYVGIGREVLMLTAELAAELGSLAGVTRLLAISLKQDAGDRWLREWHLGEGLARLFDGRDGRASATTLAAAYTTSNEPFAALVLMNRAAELYRESAAADHLQLDAKWHWYQEQYELALAELAVPEHLPWARKHVSELQPYVPSEVLATLRVALERRGNDSRALSVALAEQAFMGVGSMSSRVDWLVEAAGIAERYGDLDAATVYYRAALGLQRTSVPARMGLGLLMVRLGRHREQADLLLELSTGLEAGLASAQRDLAVFLQAEALDALGRPDEAYRLLEEAEERIGPRPLIVLGLAEHADRVRKSALALGYFAAALGGNLFGLRNPAAVALQAARVAAQAGNTALALQWLVPSLEDESTRPAALVLQAELEVATEALDPTWSPTDLPAAPIGADALQEFASNLTGEARSSAAELAAHGVQMQQAEGAQTDTPMNQAGQTVAMDSEASESQLAVQPRVERQIERTSEHFRLDEEYSTLERALEVGERALSNPEHLRNWFADGKRCLRRWPLSLRLAELVREGAKSESHGSHVAALTQLIGVLRGEEELLQPGELGPWSIDVDAMRNILLRDLNTPEGESLALMWDGAEHEFVKEAIDYDITGVMRVVGTASALARFSTELVRHFGIPRTPVFFRRASRPLVSRVVLLNPVAALLEGELPNDERALGYRVGSALWATIPEHALLFGIEREAVEAVLRALTLAFGVTGKQPNTTASEPLRLAQVLWQTVKSRSQRRLKEICSSSFDAGRALEAANRSLRRAGLYACGDLRVALTMTCHELLADPQLVRESRWSELSERVPELIDLFRIASSAEFAEMRWQVPGRRGPRDEGG
jgi:tetratricopeptide (TPR) repeat protein